MKTAWLMFVIFLSLIACSCHRQTPVQSKTLAPSKTLRTVGAFRLTTPGSVPFHLRANVVEATNLDNDSYKAEIEEYWAGPNKWRRTVRTTGFSMDIVVNGDNRIEFVSGDYYPNWLQTLVGAIFDPDAPIRDLDLTAPSDNPMPGSALRCRRYPSRIGILPVQNRVFSTICFDDDNLHSIDVPGYSAEYKNYKDFEGRQIPQTICEYIEPGTELEARITELSEVASFDESRFAVKQPASRSLHTVKVEEDMLRKLAIDRLDLKWPPIKDGKSEGVLSIYVCLDRTGKVREMYALNSDHPEMSDAAQQQLIKFRFKPATFNNEPAQTEGMLTFAYQTVISNH